MQLFIVGVTKGRHQGALDPEVPSPPLTIYPGAAPDYI